MSKRSTRSRASSSLTVTAVKRKRKSSDSDLACSSHQKEVNTKVNTTQDLGLLPEEDDFYTGLGSHQQLQDLFNPNKQNGSSQLSFEDMKKAEEDMRQFLENGNSSPKEKTQKNKDKGQKKTSKSTAKGKGKTNLDANPQNKTAKADLDVSYGTEELLREVDELLNPSSTSTPSTTTSPIICPSPDTSARSKRNSRSKTLRSNKKKKGTAKSSRRNKVARPVEEILISGSDEDISDNQRLSSGRNRSKKRKIEVHEISDDEPEIDLGHNILFHAELKSEKFPIRMYEKQYVRELRAMVAEKAKSPPEMLQMFLGDYTQLEDDKTLLESGITNLSIVETYLIYKSEKELYEEGSASVFKFKLQTEDRRGRQDAYVFVSRSGKMQSAVEQYAKGLGISCSGMKLRFDGDEIDLSLTPEECDLEGGECLDLQV